MVETKVGLDRIAIVVAGMHRSGTSMLTDCLARLGASLPGKLIPADAHNPRGYFESAGLNRLFNQVLESTGRSWDDWRALPHGWQSLPATAAVWAGIQEELREAFGDSRTFVLKDPRVCRFVGELGAEIQTFGAETCVVVPVRHPMEVARSLSVRDGFSLTKGGLLWLRHVLEAEKASRPHRRTFVTYDDLMSDWHAAASRIGAQLGVALAERGAISGSPPVDAGLRHHRQDRSDGFGDAALARWADAVHAGLLRLVRRPDDPAVLSILDGIHEEFDVGCRLFGQLLDEIADARSAQFQQQDHRVAGRATDAHAAAALAAERQKLDLQARIDGQARRIGALKRKIANRDRLFKQQAERLERAQLEVRVAAHLAQACRIKGDAERPKRFWERVATVIINAIGRKDSARKRSRQEKWTRSRQLVSASELFDADWYLARYADVAGSGMEPLDHFVRHGDLEGRDPGPGFDSAWYRRHYPDLGKSVSPLLHFLRHGLFEGRASLPSSYNPAAKSTFDQEETEAPGSDKSDYAEHYFAARRTTERLPSSRLYEPLSAVAVDSRASEVKAIAFYLPQFHPITENDAAWGKGFTEWTNVSKAIPEFLNHYQPHLPGELGFYDLRVPAVMARQVALAKQHGIHGFCFHHYWFGGRRVLEKPVQQFLADRSIDIPFCLSWANENWSRRWDGSEHELIIEQNHSPDDDLDFIADLMPAFQDPRYIRIDGRPVLIVYRASILPDARETAERWRSYCRAQGLGEIFLVYAQTFHFTEPPSAIGFDAALEFPPHSLSIPNIASDQRLLNPRFRGLVGDYRELVRRAREAPPSDYLRFPAVFPSWDNSPRRPGRGTIFVQANPAHYREWLEACFDRARRDLPPGHRFVFINAWNEWGEGAHLEPDRRYGYAWLNATAAVVSSHSRRGDRAEATGHIRAAD